MMPLEIFAKAGIYALMAIGVLAALATVTLRNLFHSGLCLAAVLISVAGIYVSLGAEFLAAVQVLIYVGAVMTLIIYVIMLTGRVNAGSVRQTNRQSLPALIGGLIFIVLVGRLVVSFPWPVRSQALEAEFSVRLLGKALMSAYIFPFEIIGVVLLAVLIGAIVIARRDRT